MDNSEASSQNLLVRATFIRRCLAISEGRTSVLVVDASPLLPPVGSPLTFGKFQHGVHPLLDIPFNLTLEEILWYLLNPEGLPLNPPWTLTKENICSICTVPRLLHTDPSPYPSSPEVPEVYGVSYPTFPAPAEFSYTTQDPSVPHSGSTMPRNSWLSRELLLKVHQRFGLCESSKVLVDRELGVTIPKDLPELPWLPSWFTVQTVAGILAAIPKVSRGRPRSEDLSMTPAQVGHPGIERTRSGKYRGRVSTTGGKALVTASFFTLEEAISARKALEEAP